MTVEQNSVSIHTSNIIGYKLYLYGGTKAQCLSMTPFFVCAQTSVRLCVSGSQN